MAETRTATEWGKDNPCPVCGSTDVARISYGLPAWSEEWERNLAAGEWAIGGCIIGNDSPRSRCNACEATFGSLWGSDDGDERTGAEA